jgi:glutamine cyclotransferase
VVALSDHTPRDITYRVIRTFPHEKSSYTQGLIYHGGFLYESTGRYGKSALIKMDTLGNIVQKIGLSNHFFGEGIAEFNGKIYQLTYRSHVGFIYSLASLEELRRFEVQNQEAWGLTANENNLILSDGSAVLTILNPEYINTVDQIHVADNEKLIDRLNELEWVEPDIIYANIYGQPRIAKIDMESGQVMGYIDMSELKPAGVPDNMDYVLNGIAYNKNRNTYFITGKLWPVVYEVELYD